MTIEITKYRSRHWAVLVDGRLLCVTVYKKGALAVRDALLNGGSKAPSLTIPQTRLHVPELRPSNGNTTGSLAANILGLITQSPR